ncbi:glycosyltransferase family 61 protein, partial [Gammaproteobacteria bacterium]|nr:glycosyltransferase family 61 protein [Gammaproteobacteria bacterium]
IDFFVSLAESFGARQERRWRQLINASAFIEARGISVNRLLQEKTITVPEPEVFPSSDRGCLDASHEHKGFPEIFIATINNGMTYGGSNLILVDEAVICHDLFDCRRDSTSEELHGRVRIDPRKKRIRWLLYDDEPEIIAKAGVFVDACAANYAHWLSEVLPRIALFCAEDAYKDAAIVVNDDLHENIMSSLALIAGSEREIITLPIGRALMIQELYLTSVVGYVPFDRRKKAPTGHSHGIFSPQAFEAVRERLSSKELEIEGQYWPEKIFLRRNSGTRKLTNIAEVESLLVAHNFVLVEPEKLSYLQQVHLFKNAKKIISPTGAALSNAIFCKPGAQVAVLMGKHKDMIYRYWHQMLAPLQVKISYVLGNIVQANDLGIHGDFLIEMNDLENLLEAME